MKKSNQSGFAAIEALLVVIILAIVGFTGWYVWHAKQATNRNLNNASNADLATKLSKSHPIATFGECKAAAGSKILQTSPEKCVTKDGKTFTDTSASSTSDSATQAVNLVQTSYDTALSYVKRTTNADQGEIDAIKDNLDPALYSKLSAGVKQGVGYDQILCGQMTPGTLKATLTSDKDGIATVSVNETYGTSQQTVQATVDMTSLKIASITCPS